MGLKKLTNDNVKRAENTVKNLRYDTGNAMINIDNWMHDNYNFRYNEVTSDYEMLKGGNEDWEEGEPDVLYHQMKREAVVGQRGDVTKGDVENSFKVLSKEQSFNPFRDYFDALPAWDGKDRLKMITDSVIFTNNEDKKYFAKQMKKHLIRSIHQALDGVVNRYVFVFVSKQKTGKTTFIRFINPFGKEYYTEENFVADNKDNQIALTSNYIYNMEEIENMTGKEISQFKSTVSKQTVNVRLPYAKRASSIPRRCTFFGSTNNENILSDDENTRWIIFGVDGFKKDDRGRFLFMKYNRFQIWSQIHSLYQHNVSGELNDAQNTWISNHTKSFRMASFEEDLISEIYEACKPGDVGCNLLKSADVAMAVKARSNATVTPNVYKIASALKVLGYKNISTRVKGKPVRGYWMMQKMNTNNVFDIGNNIPDKVDKDLPF